MPNLYKTIPKKWHEFIEQDLNGQIVKKCDYWYNSNFNINTRNGNVNVGTLSTKSIYFTFIQQINVRQIALNKWLEVLYIEDCDWSRIFQQPYLSSRETNLQSLQYKIIHRIFPCQKWLYNHKVILTPNCQVCGDTEDNLIHYFIECRGIGDFWSQLESWWNQCSNDQVILTTKHIIFGLYYDNVFYSAINHVLLLAKWYFYNCKRKQIPICFYNFLVEIKRNLETEEYICAGNNTSHLFAKKWSKIYHNL